MRFHLEVLTRKQTNVLKQIVPVLNERNILGGGTIVAPVLGVSPLRVDFDWFTSRRLADPVELAKQIQSDGVRYTGAFPAFP